MNKRMKIDQETGEITDPETLDNTIGNPPFLRTPFNYDRDAVSLASGLECPEPTLAQQQFKEDADINVILERFGVTGQLPENVRVPQSGDFADAPDYKTSLNLVIEAREAFMEMPADVRERFAHDPGKFLEFVHDDKNRDEAKKLGILVPEPKPAEPSGVKITNLQELGDLLTGDKKPVT